MAEKQFSGKLVVNGTAINIGNGSSSSLIANGIEPYIIYMTHADFGKFSGGYGSGGAPSSTTGSESTSDTTSHDNIIDNSVGTYWSYIVNYPDASESDKNMISEIVHAFFTGRPIYLYLNTPFINGTATSNDNDDYYEYLPLASYIGSNAAEGTEDTTTNIYIMFIHNNNGFINIMTTGDEYSKYVGDYDRRYNIVFTNVPNDVADLNNFAANDTLIGKWANTTE